MVAWAGVGHGLTPDLSPNAQTGKAVITLEDVHDVTLSHLTIGNVGTDDGIDVIGSSDISLENLQMNHTLTTAGPAWPHIRLSRSAGREGSSGR